MLLLFQVGRDREVQGPSVTNGGNGLELTVRYPGSCPAVIHSAFALFSSGGHCLYIPALKTQPFSYTSGQQTH